MNSSLHNDKMIESNNYGEKYRRVEIANNG